MGPPIPPLSWAHLHHTSFTHLRASFNNKEMLTRIFTFVPIPLVLQLPVNEYRLTSKTVLEEPLPQSLLLRAWVLWLWIWTLRLKLQRRLKQLLAQLVRASLLEAVSALVSLPSRHGWPNRVSSPYVLVSLTSFCNVGGGVWFTIIYQIHEHATALCLFVSQQLLKPTRVEGLDYHLFSTKFSQIVWDGGVNGSREERKKDMKWIWCLGVRFLYYIVGFTAPIW